MEPIKIYRPSISVTQFSGFMTSPFMPSRVGNESTSVTLSTPRLNTVFRLEHQFRLKTRLLPQHGVYRFGKLSQFYFFL